MKHLIEVDFSEFLINYTPTPERYYDPSKGWQDIYIDEEKKLAKAFNNVQSVLWYVPLDNDGNRYACISLTAKAIEAIYQAMEKLRLTPATPIDLCEYYS